MKSTKARGSRLEPAHEEFIEQARDRLVAALFTRAQHAQVAREGGDYAAVTPSRKAAEGYVESAGEFLAAVEKMLGE